MSVNTAVGGKCLHIATDLFRAAPNLYQPLARFIP
jgi:hypothetical protein